MHAAGRWSLTGVLGPAVRLVRRRIRADPLVLSAALVTVVLASTIVAAGPVYSSAVARSGLRHTLADAPVRSVGVQVSGRFDPGTYASTDRAVTTALAGALSGTAPTIYRSAQSQSFELPGQPAGQVTKLAVLGFADRITEQADLVDGSWPTAHPGGGALDTAVSEPVAAALGLRMGSSVPLRARLDQHAVTVRVVAVYRVRDPASVMWWDNPLETQGITVQSFTTYGPFLVTESEFSDQLASRGASAYWRGAPDHAEVPVGGIGAVAARVAALDSVVDRAVPDGNLTVDTGLPALLKPAERSLLMTRGVMLVPTAQVAVLAAFALLLSAGLLLETRHVETALLRARGATAGQVGAVAAVEAALVAVPATALGPVLAVLAVKGIDRVGPVADIGFGLQPRIGAAAFVAAGLTALLCATALIIPTVLSARTFAAARRSRGRQPLRALVSHIRLDLVIVAIGMLLLWQLRRYGSALTETTGGVLGIDPLLVGAPAVGLLGGALVVLRVVPPLARYADRWATAQPGLTAPLGAWQLARRPARYTSAALLLILALAIGLFTVAYTDTWRTSQQDQADFAVGADVRIVHGADPTGPPIDVPGGHEAVAGVRRSMPVVRDRVSITATETADLLAVGAADLPEVLRLRGDLSRRSVADLAADLDRARTLPLTVPLPSRPRRVRLEVSIEGTAPAVPPPAVTIAVVIRDAGGILYRLPAAPRPGGRLVTVSSGAARYPLSLAAIELSTPAPETGAARLAVTVALMSSDLTDGEAWRDVDISGAEWTGTADELDAGAHQPAVVSVTSAAGRRLVLTLDPGADATPGQLAAFRVAPAASAPTGPLAAVVTDRLLALTQRQVGDVVSIDVAGARREVRVVGSLRAAPTLPRDSAGVVVDLAQLSAVRYADGGRVLTPAEWWLATDGGVRPDTVTALTAALPGGRSTVQDRISEGRRLRGDVAAVGFVGGLAIALVAAGLLAAVGFAVSIAVAVRQRLSELALLRALGVSPGQVAAALAVEHALAVSLSLLGGTLLGLVLTRVVVPAFVLTRAGATAVPAVRVVVPWRAVALLELGIVAGAVAVVAVAGLALRGIRVGALLRAGGDT